MALDCQPGADRRVLPPNSPDLYCYSDNDMWGSSVAPPLRTTMAPTSGLPHQQPAPQLDQQSPATSMGQSHLYGPHHLPIRGMGVLPDLQRGLRENVALHPVQGHPDGDNSGILGVAPNAARLHASSPQARAPASRASGEP